MKIAYLNTVPTGSTGSIIRQLRHGIEKLGHNTQLYYGRGPEGRTESGICVGNMAGTLIHGVRTRLADSHGLASRNATLRLIRALEKDMPEVVHLHNLHGYWLNYPLLFQHLTRLQNTRGLKIVWTLHDSWSVTGGCALPDAVGCELWCSGCNTPHCPGRNIYPRTYARHAPRNFALKKKWFTLPDHMTIVTPSEFMARRVAESFLGNYPRRVIPTRLDAEFWTTDLCSDIQRRDNTVLAVAWPWYAEKGYADLAALRELLPGEIELRVVGLTPRQSRRLPAGITTLQHLSPAALREEYARASVLVNLSRAETLPTVCLEAQAMGCPIVSFAVGGAPEAVDPESGILVPTAHGALNTSNPSLPQLARAVRSILDAPKRPASSFVNKFLYDPAASNPFIEQHLDIYLGANPQ